MSEAPLKLQTIEIGADMLETILQPDEVLAAQSLDRNIQAAENDPQADADDLALLRFQRSLMDMNPDDARSAAFGFARATGKYVSRANNGDGTVPSLHYPVVRGLIVGDLANDERWRLLGIDPHEHYGNDAYGNAHIRDVEGSWREAREARNALATAQAAEAKAMERAAHLPVFVPEPTA